MRSRLRESASDQNQNSMRSQNPTRPSQQRVFEILDFLFFLVVKERVRPKAPQRRSLKTGSEKRTGTVS